MPLSPIGKQLVDVRQQGQVSKRRIQHRLVTVQINKQRGQETAMGEPEFAVSTQLIILAFVQDRLEQLFGVGNLAQLKFNLSFTECRIRLNNLLIGEQHSVDRPLIRLPECELAEFKEGHPLQPPVRQFQQAWLFFQLIKRAPIRFLESGLKEILIRGNPILTFDTQLDFNFLELGALETRRGDQQIAKLQKVEWRHRFDDVDLIDQRPLDRLDASQSVDDSAHFLVFNDRIVENVDDGVQFKDDLFKPQLVRLVGDDEQHFIMRGDSFQLTFPLLRVENPVELQILAVVDLLVSYWHGYQPSPPGMATFAGWKSPKLMFSGPNR